MKRMQLSGDTFSNVSVIGSRTVRIVCSLVVFVAGLAANSLGAQTPASEATSVAVLFNAKNSRSREVAEFYLSQRGIPEANLIGLECENSEILTRDQYERNVVIPLRQQLESRGLAQFLPEPAPAHPRPGINAFRLFRSSIRYLVLAYGMPYRVAHEANLGEAIPDSVPGLLRNNGASLDAELTVFPAGGLFPVTGPAHNPYQGATNAAALQPDALYGGVFLVSRLDGPTPELAMGLVTQAMQADRDGLWGRAYFDLRGGGDATIKLGDEVLNSAMGVSRLLGFETYVDTAPATLPVGFPLSDVAIYGGWYDADVSGPFLVPHVNFVPGAMAYHLHSYSALNPRSLDKSWVGPLIGRGATISMGCVDEPFLQMTPNFGVFLSRLALGFNVGEAFLACSPVLSWQGILVGDPLYRPFRPNLLDRGRELERTQSPWVPWMIVQTLNYQMQQGRPVDQAIQVLELTPQTTNNPVLAEKLARLYAEKSRLKQAITHAQRALAAGGSPEQRIRLLLDLAEWQRIMDQPKDAFATLAEFAREFPQHPRILAVRREQLDYAKDLDRTEDIAMLKAEIERLTQNTVKP